MRPVTLDRNMTPQQRARTYLDRGPHRMRTAGGYIADLASNFKAIALCRHGCERKFDPKSVGYVVMRYLVSGPCDGCRQWGVNRFFLHKDHLPR